MWLFWSQISVTIWTNHYSWLWSEKDWTKQVFLMVEYRRHSFDENCGLWSASYLAFWYWCYNVGIYLNQLSRNLYSWRSGCRWELMAWVAKRDYGSCGVMVVGSHGSSGRIFGAQPTPVWPCKQPSRVAWHSSAHSPQTDVVWFGIAFSATTLLNGWQLEQLSPEQPVPLIPNGCVSEGRWRRHIGETG